jgi:hypothetical protein
MSDVLSEDEETPDPAAARVVARVRSMMLISAATTVVAVAAVISVIGYRVFKAEGSAAVADVTAELPKGARVIATAVAEDRVVVTIDTAGGLELRIFDLKTLKPTGRLRFATEPQAR